MTRGLHCPRSSPRAGFTVWILLLAMVLPWMFWVRAFLSLMLLLKCGGCTSLHLILLISFCSMHFGEAANPGPSSFAVGALNATGLNMGSLPSFLLGCMPRLRPTLLLGVSLNSAKVSISLIQVSSFCHVLLHSRGVTGLCWGIHVGGLSFLSSRPCCLPRVAPRHLFHGEASGCTCIRFAPLALGRCLLRLRLRPSWPHFAPLGFSF